jgi:hypothetical protein
MGKNKKNIIKKDRERGGERNLQLKSKQSNTQFGH